MRVLKVCELGLGGSFLAQTSSATNRLKSGTHQLETHFLIDEANALRSANLRTASWLGFVIGLCCGMSITAVLAISILGN
tara:strand:+ start:934 stop:1173 length:240 start_codon:yes stop_codon:yes gene_type:complete